jgi:hypothetical protein
MHIRRFSTAIIIAAVFSASGCGDGGGGGSTELRTSYVTANALTAVLDADVVTWVDSAGVKATACAATSSPRTPAADSVDVSVVSTLFTSSGTSSVTNALPIRIESATVSYTPANLTTPAMASEFQTVGMILQSGATATVPVRILTQEQKMRLQSTLACNATIYNYYTTITLNVTEIGSNAHGSATTSMQLRMADFIDQ